MLQKIFHYREADDLLNGRYSTRKADVSTDSLNLPGILFHIHLKRPTLIIENRGKDMKQRKMSYLYLEVRISIKY